VKPWPTRTAKPKPLQTFSVAIALILEVIARDEQEARQLMRDHLLDFPPEWLHLRTHDQDVTVNVVDDLGQAINEGRYEDELDDADTGD